MGMWKEWKEGIKEEKDKMMQHGQDLNQGPSGM